MTEEPKRRASAARERYANVNELWAATPQPAITATEAERAARRLFRKFGRKAGYPLQRSDAKLVRVRRCWISSKPNTSIARGWARLAHDVSHYIFRKRYPQLRPHNPLHAKLEYEIAEYVATSGWLDGALRPKAKAPKSRAALRAAELTKLDAAIKRWDSKLRRAQNAIKKLSRKRARVASATEAKS